MSDSKRLRFARDAVDAVVTLLQTLPASAVKTQLLSEAEGCRAAVEAWTSLPPTLQEHEKTMKAILKLHMAAARLGRAARSASRKP